MILTRLKNEIGATAIEYGLLASLIGVATITGLQLTGVKLDNTYCYIATQISKAVGGSGGGCSASPSSSSGSSQENNENNYTVQNAYHIQAYWIVNFIQSLADNNITSITGLYNESGNELSTPEKLMNYLGVSMDTYNEYANKTSPTALYDFQSAVVEAKPWIYSKDLTTVSVGNSNGVYSNVSKDSSDGSVEISGLKDTLSGSKNTSFNLFTPGTTMY
ncbi:Flp family type IVb pilin [Acetobacter peroxydans]|uniref:Pilus assembly protein n=1 Tax=Acetobacter peroxydans TaxID=104098 RepID=A0A4Y3TY75_9PROT|nr:Flp family type IVb pilin [Acetobacter peroxydans]NHO16194.1 Flp family type IVb pilin [Acetobacter peroxydans]GBR34201.1 hypothetical protein AA13755_0785 [Acetobacter peroxydans NBRC 13755]GBR40653.1 hypothetical protein AA0475_0731 [Acetobacter peroxydans]GEB85685.1 hypothetical protein APE01nite_14820 [Acetobacter peroxydans]